MPWGGFEKVPRWHILSASKVPRQFWRKWFRVDFSRFLVKI